MPFTLFHKYFPEIAERETRTVTVFAESDLGLPAGQYGLVEMFCDERGCDCRRVFFYVRASFRADTVAIVAYGWESPEFYARWLHDDDPAVLAQLTGPVLNFGSPQSELAPAILNMIETIVLRDPAYIERLKTHYRMFRGKIEGRRAAPVRKRVHKQRKRRRK